ncbi:MAG: hypothetical protein IPK82_05860 [Polyangiaceae bacterium]|nr:hypothetical protein [Polyangiaceae bacterium]
MRIAYLSLLALTFALGCSSGDASSGLPPIPSSHDPKGADLEAGVVIAATEASGGVRLNKILHVDDFPPPLDYEFHMMAFDPKANSWEEAANMWKNKQVNVIIKHFTVRRSDFLTRDYRVLFKEPLTAEEKQIYEASKRTYPSERR